MSHGQLRREAGIGARQLVPSKQAGIVPPSMRCGLDARPRATNSWSRARAHRRVQRRARRTGGCACHVELGFMLVRSCVGRRQGLPPAAFRSWSVVAPMSCRPRQRSATHPMCQKATKLRYQKAEERDKSHRCFRFSRSAASSRRQVTNFCAGALSVRPLSVTMATGQNVVGISIGRTLKGR